MRTVRASKLQHVVKGTISKKELPMPLKQKQPLDEVRSKACFENFEALLGYHRYLSSVLLN